jgi:uncharacterized protein (TIGR02246 family)
MRFVTFAALAGLAACAPREGATGGAMALDTAAVKSGVDSTRARYSRMDLAGDASMASQLFTEDATLDLYGVPRTKGRAGIEAVLKADFGTRKFTRSDITPIQIFYLSNASASEIGTYHAMFEAGGATNHEWGRYVVGLAKGTDGLWRLDYLMAFPDSTKR